MNQCGGPIKNEPCCKLLLSESAVQDLSSPNNLYIIFIIVGVIVFLLIIIFILYLRGKRWTSQSVDNEPEAGAYRSTLQTNKRMTLIQTIAAGTRSSRKVTPSTSKASPLKEKPPMLPSISTNPPSLYAKAASLSSPKAKSSGLPSPIAPMPKASKDAPLKMYDITSNKIGL
jgi:hypothetical protein